MTSPVSVQFSQEKVTEAREIFQELLKVIKVVSTYPEGNALPRSMAEAFAVRLVEAVGNYGKLRFEVSREGVTLDGESIQPDSSENSGLASIFFDTGLAELDFASGISVSDIHKFLKIIKRCANSPDLREDLAAELWEAELENIQCLTVEDTDLTDYDDSEELLALLRPPLETCSDDGKETYEAAFICPTDSGAQVPAIVHDVALNDREQIKLDRMLQLDADFDHVESAIALINELFQQEIDLDGFNEIVVIVERVLDSLVTSGELRDAGRLLECLRGNEDELRADWPALAQRLNDVYIAAGSQEGLKRLSEAANNHPDLPASQMKQYLEYFDWQALRGITALLGDFEHRAHREALCDYLAQRGAEQIDIVAGSIFDKRWYVVRNCALILGRIGTVRAMAHLKHLVDHVEKRVRWEVLLAVGSVNSDTSVDMLGQLVYDVDFPISQKSIAVLVSRSGPRVFHVLGQVIGDSRFGRLPRNESRLLLRAFSRTGGKDAVPYLLSLLGVWRFFNKASVEFYRRLAFEALAINESPEAEAALSRLTRHLRPIIRTQALVAMGWREDHFGSDD